MFCVQYELIYKFFLIILCGFLFIFKRTFNTFALFLSFASLSHVKSSPSFLSCPHFATVKPSISSSFFLISSIFSPQTSISSSFSFNPHNYSLLFSCSFRSPIFWLSSFHIIPLLISLIFLSRSPLSSHSLISCALPSSQASPQLFKHLIAPPFHPRTLLHPSLCSSSILQSRRHPVVKVYFLHSFFTLFPSLELVLVGFVLYIMSKRPSLSLLTHFYSHTHTRGRARAYIF